MRAAGGEVYAVSSEPQDLTDRARSEWQLDFECVGDPHHEIAEDCRAQSWLDLFVNPNLDFLKASVGENRGFRPTHPKGFFQPGVLAITREGRVLYRWRGVPTHSNMGGATERPTAEHVRARIVEALAADAGEDAALDTDPTLDSRGLPWPVFSTLLIANGWFLRGQGFSGVASIRMALLRLVAFIAAWVAAFALLPTLPVAAALAAWIVFIVPKYRFLGSQFQHVDATDTA